AFGLRGIHAPLRHVMPYTQNFGQARARGFGTQQAGYKTAADTSFRHHIKINLANRAVSI
ncbi:hypothetical protein, partial [Caballeronia udeis]|uniref:hypothetical protein n=1 Tax=Caballeronia udeis TaxID=1232866 RepID=UPI001E5050EA